MANNTYYAACEISIQSCVIARGQVVGTGDVDAGEFKPAKGLEKFVEIDHVQARLESGKITTNKPTGAPAGKTKLDAPEDESTEDASSSASSPAPGSADPGSSGPGSSGPGSSDPGNSEGEGDKAAGKTTKKKTTKKKAAQK